MFKTIIGGFFGFFISIFSFFKSFIVNTKRVFANKNIRKKILFTLACLVVYNIALFIQVPMVNERLLPIHPAYEGSWIREGSFFSFLNTFSGGALQNMSIVALGVGPYITSSIIVQLLQMDIVPVFKKWTEEGELGKKKINQATRYIAIVLAFVQALTMTIAFHEGIFKVGVEATALTYLYLAILITAGTSFLMWLGDQITTKGIGNGTSMIIVSGILITFPKMILDLYSSFIANGTGFKDYFYFALIMTMFILVIVAVIYIQDAVRKVPVQYSNRQQVGAKDSNIPIKLNSAGVMPVIFAVTFLTLPALVMQITDAIGWTSVFAKDGSTDSFILNHVFSQTKPIGFVVYILLIFVFGIFYAFLQVSPEKIAENLQKQNAFIPGIRPGEETAAFLSERLFKVSLLGAIFLVVIAALPILTGILLPAFANVTIPSSVQIGGTSILIVVGVAMETAKQIETELSEKTYKGFLR